MKDDRLQGILFTEETEIDLSRRTAKQKLAKKMLVTKNVLQNWRGRQQTDKSAINNEHFVITKKDRQYKKAVDNLADRLKARD